MQHILFVCTGNICRSPTAEAIFRDKLEKKGVGNQFFIDSAGTHGYHIGEPPDSRTIAVALERGVDMRDLRARKISQEDFEKFDVIFAMDQGHYQDLLRLQPRESRAQVKLFLNLHPKYEKQNVPDPYYDNHETFVRVFNVIEETAENWVLQSAC